jgi:hypothetical protein
MKLKKTIAVTLTVITTLTCPQIVAADDMFTSKEFLKLNEETQAFYMRTSIGMLSLVVGQTNQTDGKCIENWYFVDEKKANAYIADTMQRFPDYHPRGVILAVAEKKCGKFIYK